jgi:predicted TIM-barrel fold metal-dependent hydrolase
LLPINRRQFSLAVAGVVASPFSVRAQSNPWGGPVVDCHHHLRRNANENIAHLDGCGVSNAMVLARENAAAQILDVEQKYPGRVLGWFASTDVTKSDAEALLTKAIKNGAIGFGEIKYHVEAAGPEMKRAYALAADLNVPILVHFQEVPHSATEGVFSTGFKNFETTLKAFPKTCFIGHADAFWANVSADYANEMAYPSGPIKPGGITDKLLSDYPNLYGDLSANSGNNALSRDPEFTVGFLKRHEGKLIFGSDCSCTDGKGGGTSHVGNPAASRLEGKCVARETLTLLQKTVPPAAFRKMTWENAHRVYKLNA